MSDQDDAAGRGLTPGLTQGLTQTPTPTLTPTPSQARRSRIRVRYAETDQMGVVYYGNYLVWFEIGRTDWLRETGSTYRDLESGGMSLPVIEAHCEYRQPARYDDEIEILTRATLLSPIRVRFDYEVRRAGEVTPLATGYTVHAALDRSGKPCRLPEAVRDALRGAGRGAGPEPAAG